jgi:hypothetical protein
MGDGLRDGTHMVVSWLLFFSMLTLMLSHCVSRDFIWVYTW